jgi:hypothetical protein
VPPRKEGRKIDDKDEREGDGPLRSKNGREGRRYFEDWRERT